LFVYLQRNPRADHYKEEDLPSNISLSEVTDFLRSLPCHKAELVPCGSETLDESMIKAVEISVEVMLKDKRDRKRYEKYVTLMVKPHLLYRPSQYNASLYPDPYVKFFLFDRVICARDSGAVPLGWKGTVIGVHGGRRVVYVYVFTCMALLCESRSNK
jgi:5'-3' exoribonuclease 1